jgi:hypothetical protein
MAATKVENYTAEMTTELVNAYTANPTAETVALFAEKFGKSVKSVVAKLSRERAYVKQAYVSKNGATPVKKDELATELQEAFGLTEAEADSLTKANKGALLKLTSRFRTLNAYVKAVRERMDSMD